MIQNLQAHQAAEGIRVIQVETQVIHQVETQAIAPQAVAREVTLQILATRVEVQALQVAGPQEMEVQTRVIHRAATLSLEVVALQEMTASQVEVPHLEAAAPQEIAAILLIHPVEVLRTVAAAEALLAAVIAIHLTHPVDPVDLAEVLKVITVVAQQEAAAVHPDSLAAVLKAVAEILASQRDKALATTLRKYLACPIRKTHLQDQTVNLVHQVKAGLVQRAEALRQELEAMEVTQLLMLQPSLGRLLPWLLDRHCMPQMLRSSQMATLTLLRPMVWLWMERRRSRLVLL